ncbi:MAG: transcription-repair coupling factor, partial [Bdellovibrionales bacterium]|nr:transcription-repair coupling factor [Bdellovibrionales bacterium]
LEGLFLSPAIVAEKLNLESRTYFDHVELLSSENSAESTVKVLSTTHVELVTKLRAQAQDRNPLAPLREFIERWRSHSFAVVFVVGSLPRGQRLKRMLFDLGYDVPLLEELSGMEWCERSREFPIGIIFGHLSAGATIPDERLVFVSENELFGERSYRTGKQAALSVKQLLGSLSQLKENDFIVHADFGIGIYRGFVHKVIEGKPTDLLQLEYADSTLFLPLTSISKVQRFSAAEGQSPTIDKLSSQRWKKTKEKVKNSVLALAGDLIRLYAARSIAKGWHFDPAGAEDERFADGFPFDETPDQRKAIEDTLADMASERPMDRLVCGDVGFGKTEVALRAAYKAAQHSKQVAVLAPTTLLVEQHRATFQSRFAEFPVRISAVSRFYSAEKNQKVLSELASGELDIIIGTHRLLQKDIRFRDLGLLIIDEEHRFGVKQKERLKQLKKHIDVLTLTATPIPRTLHMSLLDLRSISLITTPPVDRRSTRTYVATEDEILIRDAILRELQRGGQAFFVHNRVQSIAFTTQELSRLVPEARFEFAHGQMKETELEQIMLRFLQREIDVLVCTTIIESGIDIPNANTILINRADAFGLAQLYQLRGRVGRSSRQAYCYFLIPNKKKLRSEAQQRLRALQSLDELGLGFHLALRDLEIRGAGNLLGKEQSGNVLSVGFDLYMKILRDAVHHLTGDELSLEEVSDPEVRADVISYIPEFYIPDISERLVLYQRFASLRSEEDALDLQTELEDRFGPLPIETSNLLHLMSFRGQLRRFGVDKADISEQRILLSFIPEARFDPSRLLELIERKSKYYRFSKGTSLKITDPSLIGTQAPEVFHKTMVFLRKVFPNAELESPKLTSEQQVAFPE